MCFLSSKTLVYHVWPQNSTWAKEIPACKKRVQVCSFDYLFTIFFSIYWNELVAKFFSLAEVELTIWVQTQQGTEILCSHFAVSCGSEPVSGLSWELLYCCSLFSFFFLKLSCSNLVLTKIWIPLPRFRSTWNLSGAWTSQHVRAWHISYDFSMCVAHHFLNH